MRFDQVEKNNRETELLYKNMLTRNKEKKIPLSGEFVVRPVPKNESSSTTNDLNQNNCNKRKKVSSVGPNMNQLSKDIADVKAKIKSIEHSRTDPKVSVDQKVVNVKVLENTLQPQLESLQAQLKLRKDNKKSEDKCQKERDCHEFLASIAIKDNNICISSSTQSNSAVTSSHMEESASVTNNNNNNNSLDLPVTSSHMEESASVTNNNNILYDLLSSESRTIKRHQKNIIITELTREKSRARRTESSKHIETMCACDDTNCQKKTSNLKMCAKKNCCNSLAFSCKWYYCSSCEQH